MHHRRGNRILSIAAISGALLLFIGTWLHPMQADPNNALAAFTEYAADSHWILSHLMQLAGVALMATALVLLSRLMTGGFADAIAFVGAAGATASLAVAAALQAVDGIALKALVYAWASAPATEKKMLFCAAFAVRQIEIGLAAMTAVLLGVTASIYGIALLKDSRFPKWLGVPAIVGGVPTAIAGGAIAYTGFSDLSMNLDLPSTTLLLLWMISVGVYLWRRPVREDFRISGPATE
ncbi:MAG: hypothetical protein HY269_08425 [Deltaproteobacteria bacterium]|nr:hypothetical protein [Deltaproteobacteria bacterium]